MKRVTSRKKKVSWLRKLFSDPTARIVAAVLGGFFSLSSAVVSRGLPKLPDFGAFFQADLAPQVEVVQIPAAIPPAPATPPGLETPPDIAVPVVPKATSFAFDSKSIAPSFARAEAQSPARNEAAPMARRGPNLTYGVWTVFAAKDARGTFWNNSTLKITNQQETADGLRVSGFLDWRANGKCAGREYVVGNYVEETRSLYLQGHSSSGCNRKLALSACSATLSVDGRRLTDGVWGSVSAHHRAVPGRWEAIR